MQAINMAIEYVEKQREEGKESESEDRGVSMSDVRGEFGEREEATECVTLLMRSLKVAKREMGEKGVLNKNTKVETSLVYDALMQLIASTINESSTTVNAVDNSFHIR